MKKFIILAAAGVLTAFLSACDAGSHNYNESYDQLSYHDDSYGPTQGERPLFPLSPSGGNTYYDDTGQ